MTTYVPLARLLAATSLAGDDAVDLVRIPHLPAMMLSPTKRSLLYVLLLWVSTCAPLLAQKKDDDEIQKLKKGDPYTKQDPEAMKALGVVSYGPFPWADHFTTADVDKVLGEGRVLWMETEHFRLGFNLKTSSLPDVSEERKSVIAECKALNKKWRKFPAKPKKLGPWIRVHLYAQRCERSYVEFADLVGATDKTFDKNGKTNGTGPYLGLPGKFLLMMFQKKSDMARYLSRFCNDTKADESWRHFHDKTGQLVLCISQEGMEGFDAQGLHGHMSYAMWQNMLNGYRGYHYPLPLWFSTGIAHYYSRQIKTKFVNANIRDTESVDRDTQNKWALKVLRRSKHEGATMSFDQLSAIDDWDKFGYHAHLQSWSRIDYLMHLDKSKVGLMIDKLKSVPGTGDWDAQGKQLQKMLPKLLFNVFDLDGETFDANWRKWVLKTYPKRK